MNTNFNFISCLVLICILISCNEEEVVEQSQDPIYLIEDGNLEQESHAWEFFNVYDGVVTDEHHVESVDTENFLAPGNYSLSISSDSIGGIYKYSIWRYTVDIISLMDSRFEENMNLVISANIKGNNLQGEGVSIAFSQISQNLEIYKTTHDDYVIEDTFDFTQYTLRAPFDPDTHTLYIFLVMLNTTGTVYFDNIEAYLETY